MAKHFVRILVLAAAGWLTGPSAAGRSRPQGRDSRRRLIDGVSAGRASACDRRLRRRITAVQDGLRHRRRAPA